MRLRERLPEKEIAGHFKFAPRNSIDRIYDVLSKRSVDGRSPTQLIQESVQLERNESIRKGALINEVSQ